MDLELRSDNNSDVQLVDAELDGAGPLSPGPGRIRAHGVAGFGVFWQVRCAEVGNLAGPRLLDLQVRLRSATPYAVEVPLHGELTDGAFHEAIVAACDVLVAR